MAKNHYIDPKNAASSTIESRNNRARVARCTEDRAIVSSAFKPSHDDSYDFRTMRSLMAQDRYGK